MDVENLLRDGGPNKRGNTATWNEMTATQRKVYLGVVVGLAIFLCIFVLSTIAFLNKSSSNTSGNTKSNTTTTQINNLILIIGDGFGPSQATLAREIRRFLNIRPPKLTIDPLLVGTLSTYSASNRITDSAAAATALASGYKTGNGMCGVDPSGRPLTLIVEAAKRAGLGAGLVTNSNIYSATPAGFSSHVSSRSEVNAIVAQQLNQSIDILLGGGMKVVAPTIPSWRQKGYSIITTAAGLNSASTLPLLGVFADAALDFVIDRVATSTQPTLSQMARKALQLLQQNNPRGFFVMIEGDNIDSASHSKDAPAVLKEVLELDATVSVALEFAQNNPGTLVIVTADHDCGGSTLGMDYQNTTTYEDWLPGTLLAVQKSVMFMALKMLDNQDIRSIVQQYAGIALSDAEVTNINYLFQYGTQTGSFGPLLAAIGEAVSSRAFIGWTTREHTAVDVNLYISGDDSADLLRGNNDNTDLAKYMAQKLRLTL